MLSKERPKAKAYRVRYYRDQVRIPTGREIWYAHYHLYQVNDDHSMGIHYHLAILDLPCRSNLHRFLVGLLLNWKWDFNGDLDVTEEQVKYLQIIFNNQRDYKFWRQGLECLEKNGKEKTWEWIEEQMPLLKLRNKLEGRE